MEEIEPMGRMVRGGCAMGGTAEAGILCLDVEGVLLTDSDMVARGRGG